MHYERGRNKNFLGIYNDLFAQRQQRDKGTKEQENAPEVIPVWSNMC